MPRKKKKADPLNQRLDAFLDKLEIGKREKAKILRFVEDLTFEQLKPKRKVSKIEKYLAFEREGKK